MKKTRGKLHFFIFRKIFAPLEAKMMNHDKKMDKNEKKMKKMKKKKKKMKKTEENRNFSFFGKLQFSSFFFHFFFIFSFFFHFFIIFLSFSIIFHHFSSIPPLEAKMIKNDKKMKKTRGKLHFFIFRKKIASLEAKMMKHDKKNDNNEKKRKK